MFLWIKGDITEESRRDKFLRLHKARVDAVADKIRLLSQLENPYTYEYSRNDIDNTVSMLMNLIAELEIKFKRGLAKRERIRGRVA